MIYILIACIIAWIFLAIVSGYVEANLFHSNSRKSLQFKRKWGIDIHVWFNILRAFPATILCGAVFWKGSIIDALLFGATLILLFPFFHDGQYYTTRNNLSMGTIYKDRWEDQSTTTSAIFSLPYGARVACLMLSLIFIFLIIRNNYNL